MPIHLNDATIFGWVSDDITRARPGGTVGRVWHVATGPLPKAARNDLEVLPLPESGPGTLHHSARYPLGRRKALCGAQPEPRDFERCGPARAQWKMASVMELTSPPWANRWACAACAALLGARDPEDRRAAPSGPAV